MRTQVAMTSTALDTEHTFYSADLDVCNYTKEFSFNENVCPNLWLGAYLAMMCSPTSECYVRLFLFDLFRPFHLLARPSHLLFNHSLCVSVCVCVLGKHPELKRISKGTLPWSKQSRIQLAGTYCVTHNPPVETIDAANPCCRPPTAVPRGPLKRERFLYVFPRHTKKKSL